MRTLSAFVLLVLASAAQAHYHMLLPDKPSAKKGEEVTVTCQFGHPFESELSVMLAPESVKLIEPDGKTVDVTKKLEMVSLEGVKGKVASYRLKFTPEQRGDYAIELVSAPTPLPGTKETIRDVVKVVVHVQAQKGWDRASDARFGCRPLTRPYGLLPGAVFQVHYSSRLGMHESPREAPHDDLLVEVERYNPTPPKELPADEFITRTVKTDPNGVATANLPEAGWWCLTATSRDSEVVIVGGKKAVVKRRATLWVYVDKSAPVKPAE